MQHGNLTYTPCCQCIWFGHCYRLYLPMMEEQPMEETIHLPHRHSPITVNAVNDEPSFVKGADQTINEDAAAQNIVGWATSINKGAANESAQILTFTVTNDNNGIILCTAFNQCNNRHFNVYACCRMLSERQQFLLSYVMMEEQPMVVTNFATQTFTITVNSVNDEPSFVKGANQTVNEDAAAQNYCRMGNINQ